MPPVMLTPKDRAQALYTALTTVAKDRIELQDENITRAEIAEYGALIVKLDLLLTNTLSYAGGDGWPV